MRNRSRHSHEFSYTVCIENKWGDEKDHEILVKITHYDPGCPAKLTGHPDSWYPADPEEIEWEIWIERGRRKRKILKWCEFNQNDKIIDEIKEAIYAEMDALAKVAKDDAAESRYESMKEAGVLV